MRRYIAWIVIAGAVAACDSPLDTNPTASIDAETALTTQRGIELALNGAYRTLQTSSLWGRQELAYPDMWADNLAFTGTFTGDREVSNRNISPGTTETSNMWISAYLGVTRANFILDAINGVGDMNDATKKQYRGEALFIRALMYYELMKYYGGVPLVEHPTAVIDDNVYVAKTTLAETQAFIAKDLEEASASMSATKVNGHANKNAADALLARLYLDMAQYAKARDKATLLIGNTAQYGLLPKFDDLWTGANKNNKEMIFEVQFTTLNANATAFWFFPTSLAGRYGFAPSASLLAAFEAGDQRRASEIATAPNGQVYGFKYRDVSKGAENLPVLRLAEQYLIRAEANARLGASAATVLADVNVIRNRAGLPSLDPAVVSTQAQLLDAILQERRIELAFEGFRFFDLRRYGRATTLLGIIPEKTYFPIPQSEINANPNLIQNPGY